MGIIGEELYAPISAAKNIHDICYLASIMKGNRYLSISRVEEYEQHALDLELLKKVIKKYAPEKYKEMFRIMKPGNYSAYVGSVYSYGKRKRRNQGYGRTQEELYKGIKAIISTFPEEAKQDVNVIAIVESINNETFLPKQLTASNGVIPNQVHLVEMKKILENASNYLTFLRDTDDSGLSIADKIQEIFKFQIPYYIGPLGQEYLDVKGYNVWARRIAPGKIYPWNLEEKIDVKEAAEKFIGRMVRHCTYITGEAALPKTSLIYEKFMVLNELNNLKVNGEKIPVELKQAIYHDLFEKGKKVTHKELVKYLRMHLVIENGGNDDISGIDGDFKASLSSLGKFIAIMGESSE